MLWPSLAIATTCIALTLLANAMRDVLERTVTVRRRRRRAVTTATGSIAAVTTSIATSGADDRQLEDSTELPVVADTIVHDDDAFTADQPHEVVLAIRDLRVAYQQHGGHRHRGRPRRVARRPQGRDPRPHRRVRLGQDPDRVRGAGPAPPRRSRRRADRSTTRAPSSPGASERAYAGIRGKRIGYIPQEPMSNLDPSFTIGHQLVEPLRKTLGLSKKEATERSLALLERVGIPNPKRTFAAYPFEISGGMAQRVLIAGAVSTDPDLIIADEPTTALDVTVQAEVLDLLRDLQRERHMAMLLVTHNFGVVADLCDRVTVMQQGLFVETGPGPRDPRRPVAPVHPVPAGRDPRRGSRPPAAGLRRRAHPKERQS